MAQLPSIFLLSVCEIRGSSEDTRAQCVANVQAGMVVLFEPFAFQVRVADHAEYAEYHIIRYAFDHRAMLERDLGPTIPDGYTLRRKNDVFFFFWICSKDDIY